MNKLNCPRCGLSHIKMNGRTHYGKQNYQCLECHRQFVANSQHIKEEQKELIKKLLRERLSLRGICRVVGISLSWLLNFVAATYQQLPNHLNAQLSERRGNVEIFELAAQADEMWSFVQNKKNKQWIWIAIDTTTK